MKAKIHSNSASPYFSVLAYPKDRDVPQFVVVVPTPTLALDYAIRIVGHVPMKIFDNKETLCVTLEDS